MGNAEQWGTNDSNNNQELQESLNKGGMTPGQFIVKACACGFTENQAIFMWEFCRQRLI